MKFIFKEKIILIMILMLVVIISTSAFTLSWFSHNATAEAQNATLVTAHDTEAGVSIISMSDTEYSGETGKGIDGSKDAPYFSTTQINLKIAVSQGIPVLKINFDRLIIVKGGGELNNIPDQLANTPDVFNAFTLRAQLDDGSSTVYKLNSIGQLVEEGNEEVFMPLISGDNVINLSVVFLSENRYLQWQHDNIAAVDKYLEVQPEEPIEDWVINYKNEFGQIQFFNYAKFEYSDPMYMFCNFYIAITYIVNEI